MGDTETPDPTYTATVDTSNNNNMALSGDEWTADDAWFVPINYLTSGKQFKELEVMVSNQQPFHISALADQFRNVRYLLNILQWEVRNRSNALFSDGWTDGKARDAFMVKGPGRVLAYLQNWAEQIKDNEKALRNLLDPIDESMTTMNRYVKEYEDKAGKTDHFSFWENLGLADDQTGEVRQQIIDDRLKALKEEYDQKARELVDKLAGAYYNSFMQMRHGVGAQYAPPNVMAALPGHEDDYFYPPMPAMPNLSAAGLNVPDAKAVPPIPTITPQQLQQLQSQVPHVTIPGLPGNPNLPGLGPNGLPTAPVVGTPGLQGLNQPGMLPAMPPGLGRLGARQVPAGLNAPNLNGLPGMRGAVSPNGLGAGMLPSSLGRGISRGVLGNPNGAGRFGMLPPGRGLSKRDPARGGTLRSPSSNYTSTGALGSGAGAVPTGAGRVPPMGAGRRQANRASGVPAFRAGGVDVPEQFRRSGMQAPVAPVLGRPNRQRGRQGADAPGAPLGMRGAFAAPTATPPVLDAATARTAGGSKLPPPAGMPPQRRTRRQDQRARSLAAFAGGGPEGPSQPGLPLMPGGMSPGRRDGRYTDSSATNLVGNPDWLTETGPAASASTAPVLRNQMAAGPEAAGEQGWLPPQPGATSPVFNQSSRAAVRQAMGGNNSRPGARPAAHSQAELARRTREADHHGRSSAEAQEARPGEEAFTVQTPGGAVVGSTPAHEEEAPKPTIGNV
jgi:hypothetical protein